MQVLQNLRDDYRVEVLGAALLAASGDVSHIIIERLGINGRSYAKDQYRVSEQQGLYDLEPKTVIQSFRQSIYDMLPESLFHPPTLGGIGRTEEEIVAEIREQRKREEQARKFFQPFEQEPSYVEMQALLLELMYEQKGSYPQFYNLFAQAWPILSRLPEEVALSFIYILPILHQVRGDIAWTAQCMAFIVGMPVVITQETGLQKIPAGLPFLKTGVSRLGIDTALGGAQYDGLEQWKITVGPVPPESIEGVLPQTGFRALLEQLAHYFLPANMFYSFKIETMCTEAALNAAAPDKSRLGYSFYL